MSRFIALLAFVLTGLSAAAEPQKYSIETDRSEVTFVYQFNGDPVTGEFGITKADLEIDLQTFSKSKVSVALNTREGHAGFGFATSAMLASASGATGAKSLIGSYGIFLNRLRLRTMVLAVISSV